MRDFTPALAGIVLVFVLVGSLQFLSGLPGAERGLLLFERACPIHSLPSYAERSRRDS
jgi:hypothetical protein